MSDLIPFGRNSLDRLDDFFPSLFKNFFDNNFLTMMSNIQGNFRVDVKETENEFIVEADLPGIKKEAIEIVYHNNYLVINAKREEGLEEKKENYVRRERHYGEFKRSLYLDNVDEDKIDASFKDGVLRITLPKLNKDNKKGRRIDIR
ncbi:MAG: Hsp20/alpha crystallin family protein [Tissierellia bacterium]|nr:Hsp20/alpha crystallin family protein [Tissierellia bacterium]